MAFLLILLYVHPAQGQEEWPPLPENLFAPGIEVVRVERIPSRATPIGTRAPEPTPAPRCGFIPYRHLGGTDTWLIDYETQPSYTDASVDTPIILCNRETNERRELTLGEPIEGVSISPSQHYAVFTGFARYYGYDFELDVLITLGSTAGSYYENRTVDWHGDRRILIYEWAMPDSSVWKRVSIAEVTQENSLQYLTSILKYNDVPWFATYHSPDRTAWIEYADEGCTLEWMFQETGHRESFDVSGICEVGTPLSDDPNGDYLFTPLKFRLIQKEPYFQSRAISRTLMQLNLASGERTIWYSGEVERLNDLDPSQRYATLVVDSNECMDIIHGDLSAYSEICRSTEAPPKFEVALLDITAREIRYRHPVGYYPGMFLRRVFDITTGHVDKVFHDSMDYSATVGGDLFSLGEDHFILFQVERNDESLQGSGFPIVDDVLITLDSSGTVTETPLPGQLLLAGSDNAYLILLNTDHDLPETYWREVDLILYDREGHSIPLISGIEMTDELTWGLERQYRVSVMRGDSAEVLQVRLWNSDLQEAVVYSVRFP